MKSMFGYAQYQPHGLSQAIPIPMVCYKPYSTNELVLYAHAELVLSLCCYGKVLDFMIKNTRLIKKH